MLSAIFKLFGFSILLIWALLMKVILETRQYERNWWGLFRVVQTTLDIYVCITSLVQ